MFTTCNELQNNEWKIVRTVVVLKQLKESIWHATSFPGSRVGEDPANEVDLACRPQVTP